MSLQPRQQSINPSVSLNYSFAKVVSIFLVLAGHWFSGTILWVPVTIGLFVFGFSSGYFTSKIYGEQVDTKSFWHKKLKRLGIGYWVVVLFLIPIVLLRGGTIMHWHSLVHIAGLSGLLNWFSIPNRSSLGAGLWFLTLLLGFYLAYPLLAKIGSGRRSGPILAVVATILAIFLEENVKVGHELWLTTLGFILGTVVGFHPIRMPERACLVATAVLSMLLLGLNLLTPFKSANTALICFTSIAICAWLTKGRIPDIKPVRFVAGFETYLLEIFLIHTYLFVRPTGNAYLDLLISLVLIIGAAVALNRIAAALIALIFAPRSKLGRVT